MMHILTEIKDCQALSTQARTIGFVPTMGHLHAGHLSLCEKAKQENDITVASIFVNPTQFNLQQDFQSYPRTLEQDKILLNEVGIDYLFLPQETEIYADQFTLKIEETDLSTTLEGEYRPNHFVGMLTIVLKLLNIVNANHAYFGEKDYQQLLLIKKMASVFFLRTKIIACETVRAQDGLALSSRNSRLTQAQRMQAKYLPQLLQSKLSLDQTRAELIQLGFKVDYIAEKWGRRLAAVWLDDVRLIDNIAMSE